MKPDNKAGGPWLYALGLVPVIWFALLIAPAISGGLSEIVSALPAAMNNPFKIVWCEDSVKTVLIFVAAYGLGIGIYLSSRRNYRRGEEHGSAKWGDPRAVNKKYRDRDLFKNRIFTQHPLSATAMNFLYLGGNETSTHKLISENYLEKSTLWLDTYGKSTGHSGSYSTNNQITGRELMTPDEVRMLDNNLALLFIRGEAPLMDEKYDLLKHPNIKYTTDRGAPAYAHGGTENAVADMTIGRLTPGDLANIQEPENLYELLSDEDMENIFQFKEEKQNEAV